MLLKEKGNEEFKKQSPLVEEGLRDLPIASEVMEEIQKSVENSIQKEIRTIKDRVDSIHSVIQRQRQVDLREKIKGDVAITAGGSVGELKASSIKISLPLYLKALIPEKSPSGGMRLSLVLIGQKGEEHKFWIEHPPELRPISYYGGVGRRIALLWGRNKSYRVVAEELPLEGLGSLYMLRTF